MQMSKEDTTPSNIIRNAEEFAMKPKYYQCCVPGCPTYDHYSNFLHFPMDSNWRYKWLCAVPMRNWILDHNTVVCLKHFKANEVALYTCVKNDNGELKTIKNRNPLLKEGAIPTVFPKTSGASAENFYWPDMMFEVPCRDQSPETFADLENIPDEKDYLIDYYFFVKCYEERMGDYLETWKAHLGANFVVFYLVEFGNIPKICTSIKIDTRLKVTVVLDGREMDLMDLTWIMPVTGRINRWSQLHLLLQHFEKNRTL